MLITCPECPIRRRKAFRQFTPEELAFVSGAKQAQIDYRPRDRIVRTGGNGHYMYTILSGWAFRYKSIGDGARQILDFLLPGDPVGLQSPLTGKVRHDVDALTAVTVCQIAGEPVRDVFEEMPDLASALMSTLLLDEERADRRLLLLGRQRPAQRLAYLLLELRDRLVRREMADETACDFPLTYEHMSDALGLSRAQLARSLAELRDRGWAKVRNGEARFDDPERMAAFCAYDPETASQTRAII